MVYIGGKAVPGAREALQKASEEGMRLAYVTNNASRTPAAVAHVLNGLGIDAQPSDVVTSAQAAARLLAARLPAGAPVLVIGGMGLRVALREQGLRPVSTAAAKPAAVVQGFAPQVDYSALAQGGLAVRAGALFVGTNGDLTIPNARGIAPGNGSLLQVIKTATGQTPVIAGKPEPPLHHESVIRTGAKHPLVVGDRLDTDIEAAQRVGADSLLVLTGVTDPVPHQPATKKRGGDIFPKHHHILPMVILRFSEKSPGFDVRVRINLKVRGKRPAEFATCHLVALITHRVRLRPFENRNRRLFHRRALRHHRLCVRKRQRFPFALFLRPPPIQSGALRKTRHPRRIQPLGRNLLPKSTCGIPAPGRPRE